MDGQNAIQVLLLVAGISLVPALLFTVTGFARILIVLGFIRSGLGTPTAPPNQVLVGIALFLTLFVMQPVLEESRRAGLAPLMEGRIGELEGLSAAAEHFRRFMAAQAREGDLAFFLDLAGAPAAATPEGAPWRALLPAFLVGELKRAFEIGFLLFVPFIVIDMVVASVLMSMGMMMLPPAMISLPFKILLFVLVDGWHLVAEGLVNSFNP